MKSAAPIPLLLVLLTASATLIGCGGKKDASDQPSPPPPTVEVLQVTPQTVPVFGEVVASLNGYTNSTIRPRVSGYLLEQNYDSGHSVQKGDVLFEIDPSTYIIAVAQAEANVAKAKADLVKAQLEVGRNEELIKVDAVSQRQLDNSVQARDAAGAQVKAAEANFAQAELNLSYCTVVSPIDGVAGSSPRGYRRFGRTQRYVGHSVDPQSDPGEVLHSRAILFVRFQEVSAGDENALGEATEKHGIDPLQWEDL